MVFKAFYLSSEIVLGRRLNFYPIKQPFEFEITRRHAHIFFIQFIQCSAIFTWSRALAFEIEGSADFILRFIHGDSHLAGGAQKWVCSGTSSDPPGGRGRYTRYRGAPWLLYTSCSECSRRRKRK